MTNIRFALASLLILLTGCAHRPFVSQAKVVQPPLYAQGQDMTTHGTQGTEQYFNQCLGKDGVYRDCKVQQ